MGSLLGRGEFAQALEAAQALRLEAPENRDVLYLLAMCQRKLHRFPAALDTLSLLERHHPTFGRLFQERGHCQAQMRSAAAAIDAYSRAVALNPWLPESWSALSALYRTLGRAAESQSAAAQAAQLALLPAEIRSACAAFADGDVVLAEERVRRYLGAHDPHPEGLRLLARMATNAGADYDAELLLQQALQLAPQHEAARHEYAVVLLERQKHEQARAQLEMLLALAPANRSYLILAAAAAAGVGDYDRALPIYRRLVAETPAEPQLHLSIGNAHKTQGNTQAAIESYRQAVALAPRSGEACWSLANLKTYRFSDAEIAHMRHEEASATAALADRYHFCFALGQAFEDRGSYSQSFEYYARGNALKRQEAPYRPEVLERTARLQASLCTREFFESRPRFGDESAAPIFIVGLPRSGSTLIEQILASHSAVEGTMELANIPRLVQELRSSEIAGQTRGYPDLLAALSPEMCARLGAGYLRDTRVYRTGKAHFIDKMPNNFRHLDLIHLILPNAKIIDARREPMACCFSIFKQLFAAGQRFSYSLEDIAGYYRLYVDLMAHWDTVLPGKILKVRHEDVVNDLESSVHRLLEFCGLEFEPACLEFHRTRRSVHSASAAQVHRPVYRESIDQWRHFEPWLGALKSALG